MSEAEFERQYVAASRRGALRRQKYPLATAVRYEPNRGVIIDLNNGCEFSVPLKLLPEIGGASAKDLQRVKILGPGLAIEWPTLDQQFDVLQLLTEVVGTAALMGKVGQRGGRSRSRAKIEAARANGAKGGRPRTRKPV